MIYDSDHHNFWKLCQIIAQLKTLLTSNSGGKKRRILCSEQQNPQDDSIQGLKVYTQAGNVITDSLTCVISN